MPIIPREFHVTSRFRKETMLSISNFFSSLSLLLHLSSWAHIYNFLFMLDFSPKLANK